MSELENMLSGILNDPKQMEKLGSLARSLMGDGGPTEDTEPVIDMDMLKSLGGMVDAKDGKDRRLLEAMLPYLSDKRRSKMDRAMKIARLAGIASLAVGELGGDEDV